MKVLAEEISKVHARLLEAIDGLSEKQLTAPETFGQWSAREVLLHIAMWIGECLKAVVVWKTGHEYDWDYAKDYLAYNSFWVSAARHLSITQVIQLQNLYYLALSAEVEAIPEEVWHKRGEPRWLSEIAIEHTQEHLAKIQQYRQSLSGVN